MASWRAKSCTAQIAAKSSESPQRRRAKRIPVTLSASRWNRVIQSFYVRLHAGGQTANEGLTAYMRKLLTILNAILKQGTPWHPQATEVA